MGPDSSTVYQFPAGWCTVRAASARVELLGSEDCFRYFISGKRQTNAASADEQDGEDQYEFGAVFSPPTIRDVTHPAHDSRTRCEFAPGADLLNPMMPSNRLQL